MFSEVAMHIQMHNIEGTKKTSDSLLTVLSAY